MNSAGLVREFAYYGTDSVSRDHYGGRGKKFEKSVREEIGPTSFSEVARNCGRPTGVVGGLGGVSGCKVRSYSKEIRAQQPEYNGFTRNSIELNL